MSSLGDGVEACQREGTNFGTHSTLEMTPDPKRFWAQELGALDSMTTLEGKARVSQADGTHTCDLLARGALQV